MTARKCDKYTAQGLPLWEVQGYGTVTDAGHDVRPPWLDVRLTLPDGARVDVLAVVQGDVIAIEDAQADPPLPLAGLAALATALDAPLQEACASVSSSAAGPPPGAAAPMGGPASAGGGVPDETLTAWQTHRTFGVVDEIPGEGLPSAAGRATAPAPDAGAEFVAPDPAAPASDVDPGQDLPASTDVVAPMDVVAPTAVLALTDPQPAPDAQSLPDAQSSTDRVASPDARLPTDSAAAVSTSSPNPAEEEAVGAAAPAPANGPGGRHRGRGLAPWGAARRRDVADVYRAAQARCEDPVLAVMAATGFSRRRVLRLIASARDEGQLPSRRRRD